MPAGRGVRFTVLVEDRALERFVRECLYALGVHNREIRIVPFPRGAGLCKAVDRPRISGPGPGPSQEEFREHRRGRRHGRG